MTKIDFYVLSGTGQQARENMACRLVDKIYQLNRQIYIATESQQDAQRIDDMLWTFRPGSFIPHCIGMDEPAKTSQTPVIIGYKSTTPELGDVLLNLTHEVPLFFSQFDRVAELVSADEQSRALSRNRFKFYKDRGYELTTHEIAKE